MIWIFFGCTILVGNVSFNQFPTALLELHGVLAALKHLEKAKCFQKVMWKHWRGEMFWRENRLLSVFFSSSLPTWAAQPGSGWYERLAAWCSGLTPCLHLRLWFTHSPPLNTSSALGTTMQHIWRTLKKKKTPLCGFKTKFRPSLMVVRWKRSPSVLLYTL